MSLWVSQGSAAAIYADGERVMDFIEQHWSISNLERNRLMHALNGNKKTFKRRQSREGADEKVVNTASFPVPVPKGNAICDNCHQGFDAHEYELEGALLGARLLCASCKRVRKRDRSGDQTTCVVPTQSPSPVVETSPKPGVRFDDDIERSISPPAVVMTPLESMMELVSGLNVRGCYGLECGPRGDEPCVHFGGTDDPRPGDTVVTIEFEEYAEHHIDRDLGYRRVGSDLQLVEASAGVCDAADWLFEPGCTRFYRNMPFTEAIERFDTWDVFAGAVACPLKHWLVSLASLLTVMLRFLFASGFFGLSFISFLSFVTSMERFDLSVAMAPMSLQWQFWTATLVLVVCSVGACFRERWVCVMIWVCSSLAFATMGCNYPKTETIVLNVQFADLGDYSYAFCIVVLTTFLPIAILLEYVQEWLDGMQGVGCGVHLRASLVSKIDMDPPLYQFRLHETLYAGRDCRKRLTRYDTPTGRVTLFRGRKRSVVWYMDHVVEVSSSVLGETLRYFSSDLPARVCASHITGHLKNSDCSSEQIHACIAAASAHHRKYSSEYTSCLDVPEVRRRFPWLRVLLWAIVALGLFSFAWVRREHDTTFLTRIKEAHGFGWLNTTDTDDWEWSVGSLMFHTSHHVYRRGSGLCLRVHIRPVIKSMPWLYWFAGGEENKTKCFDLAESKRLMELFNTSDSSRNYFARFAHNVTARAARDYSYHFSLESERYAKAAWYLIFVLSLAIYETEVAPVWEEYFKALGGIYTTTIFVIAEAWMHTGFAVPRVFFYLRTTGLAHFGFRCMGPFYRRFFPKDARIKEWGGTAAFDREFAIVFHRMWNQCFSIPHYVWFQIWAGASFWFFGVWRAPHLSWSDLPFLYFESLVMNINHNEEMLMRLCPPVPDWWIRLFMHDVKFPTYDEPVGLVASISGGGFLMYQAAEFLRGRASCFVRVPAMGSDSRFVEAFQAGIFPVRDDATIRLRRGRRVRGKNELIRLMPEFVPVSSFQGNNANALHSVVGRVTNVTPDCSRFPLRASELVEAMADKMVADGPIDIMDSRDWAHTFPPAKRKRYLESLVRLSVYGLAWFYAPFGTCTGWSKRSCFIKHEANLAQLDKRTPYGMIACSDPRTIQASTDEVQALFGPHFVSYGGRASRVFDGGEGSKIAGWSVLFGFGRTKSEVSDYCAHMVASRGRAVVDCGDDSLLIIDGRVYAIDAKRWDAHIRRPLLEIKALHLSRLGMDAGRIRILLRMIKRKATFKGLGVGFEVDGNVASGDPDTLYWNTVLGVAIIISCFECCNTYQEFEDNARCLGVEYEVAGVCHSGEPGRSIDFCSCVIMPTVDGWTFAPKLGRYLMKLGVSATQGNPVKLLSAKLRGAICDLAAYPEVVRHLCRLSSKLPTVDAVHESYFPVGKCDPGDRCDREVAFAERYGVAYDDVEREVGQLVDSTLTGDFKMGELTTLRRLVEVDYGKAPLASEVGHSVSRIKRRWWFWLLLLGVVGGVGLNFDARSLKQKHIDYTVSWPGVMAGGKNQKNNLPKTGGRKAGNGKPRMKARGSGLYTLPAALTKVLKSSVVNAVKTSIPKGTFEKRGAQFGRGLANIVGFGDYVVNDIVRTNNMRNMRGSGSNNSAQIISNCEYIGDITSTGTTAFSNRPFLLEPTDTTFPWLSRIAGLYTKYRFKQLLIEYRSMSSEYSSQIGLGTIIIAPIYNQDQKDFTNKQQMEAATHAVSFKPSNSAYCGVECARKDNNYSWYNVRLGDMDRTPLTDFARLNVALAGIPTSVANGTVLGELWVHYTVELLEPLISTELTTDYIPRVGSLLTTDTAAGLFADSAFGIAKSAAGNRTTRSDSNVAASSLLKIIMTSGQPLDAASYDIAFDELNYSSGGSTQQDSVWFSRPGRYWLRWTVQWSTQPTGVPSSSASPWTVAFPIGGGSSDGWIGNYYSADRLMYSYTVALTITRPGTRVSFRPSGWTGLTAATLSGSGAVLDFSLIPLK
jgi:hypothetical protein